LPAESGRIEASFVGSEPKRKRTKYGHEMMEFSTVLGRLAMVLSRKRWFSKNADKTRKFCRRPPRNRSAITNEAGDNATTKLDEFMFISAQL
jgi:hypothetical protein